MLKDKPEENIIQKQLLLKFLFEIFTTKNVINDKGLLEIFNKKLLRDMLDVTEGLIRGAINSKGNYSHTSLKLKTSYISEKAAELKKTLKEYELLKTTHREHAIPLNVLLTELLPKQKFSNISELEIFFKKYLTSVLITLEERDQLDSRGSGLKKTMPEDWDGEDLFARFKAFGMTIIQV